MKARASQLEIQKRPIPSTGEMLPVIGVGTYRGFDVGSSRNERARLAGVLRSLFSFGGSVVDSSPMYGRAEEAVGDLLASEQAQDLAFVATKVWTEGREAGVEQMNRSFHLLQRERIDLMQVHNLVDWRTHLPTMRRWKEEERVRYLGVTHWNASAYGELEVIMRTEPLDFVQFNYSLDEREGEQRILPLAAEKGIAVLINRPFGQGRLTTMLRGKAVPDFMKQAGCKTWTQVLLKFVLANPAVTCVIPGTGNPEHMSDDCQAGVGAPLDLALVKKLTAFWDAQ